MMGAAMRSALKPDLWVIVSTHWVSTFDWFATCQPKHEGLCVAHEAPNLIPGLAVQLSRRSGVRRRAGRRLERRPASLRVRNECAELPLGLRHVRAAASISIRRAKCRSWACRSC